MGMIKYEATSAVVLLLSAAVYVVVQPPAVEAPRDAAVVEEDFALFTHARGELHCPDRELRHLCVPELRALVEEGEGQRQAAYDCCARVLEESKDDYWMLKNMTHLLLDLDGNVHVFDRESRDNDFISLGLEFGRALMAHPECLQEFDDKDEFECRCYNLYAKIMVLKLNNAGRAEEARALYDEATRFEWHGAKHTYGPNEAVRWTHFRQTPQIFMPNLRGMPVWPRESWSEWGLDICDKMEAAAPTVREELDLVLEHAGSAAWGPTYRFLFDEGAWTQIVLYMGREFLPACEELFPKTCQYLKEWLPSKPGMPWVSNQNEQVLILRMAPGTVVEKHLGPANSILNLHLGLKGVEGARLQVDAKNYTWEEGKVIAWDGSYEHMVECVDCKEARTIMMVRYMHPDVSVEHYRGMQRTHFEDIDQTIFD